MIINCSLLISTSGNGLLVSIALFSDGVWLHSKKEMWNTPVLFKIMFDGTSPQLLFIQAYLLRIFFIACLVVFANM